MKRVRRTFQPIRRSDPYRSSTKPRSSPVCRDCGAISVLGRWVRRELATEQSHAARRLCPACRQAREHYALGVVEFHGSQWHARRRQIVETVQNTEAVARARNDQERVIAIYDGRVLVTLPELARQIGRTLQRSFKGKVEYRRTHEEPFLRVVWNSDAVNGKRTPASSDSGRSTRVWRGRARRARRKAA